MLNKKSVDDINVKGKRVLVRCDFNVPLIDGKITDENRIVAALPTIKKLIADGGKVILCSHLGKPKGEPKPELSLAPVAKRLTELLGQEVKFAADPEVVGPNAKAAVEAMNDGDVVLLENTRYRAEETKNGEAFSKELASLCDVFVNDAFGTGRDRALVTLQEKMDGLAHWNVPSGGFYIWMTFDRPIRLNRLFQLAAERGVLLNPGDIYDFAADNSLRLSYSYTTPEEFADAVDVLAAVARELA